MSRVRAADVVKRRLSLASRRLGTKDPTGTLAPLLDRTFSLPMGDPRYGENWLSPGNMPLEHSFSEVTPHALRLAMEPLGPDASPSARRQEASREMRRLINQQYGAHALHWFDERSERWRGGAVDGGARFGAWFGASYDNAGLQEAKVYYELRPEDLEALSPNLQHAAKISMSLLPGLVPVFTSIGCSRRRGAQRVYFFHRGALRLLDLQPLMNRLGMGHQHASLLASLGLILGGRFTLPDGSVILSLRDTERGMEMKLEILLPAFPDPPRQMHGLIQMLLAQRPHSQRALSHWMRAMTPDACNTPGDISVVGVRVTPNMPSRLTVYFRPVGYDVPRATTNRPGQTSSYNAHDPYALHV